MPAKYAVLVRDSLFSVHPIRYFETYESLTEYLDRYADRLNAFMLTGEEVKYSWLIFRYDSKLKNYVYMKGL